MSATDLVAAHMLIIFMPMVHKMVMVIGLRRESEGSGHAEAGREIGLAQSSDYAGFQRCERGPGTHGNYILQHIVHQSVRRIGFKGKRPSAVAVAHSRYRCKPPDNTPPSLYTRVHSGKA